MQPACGPIPGASKKPKFIAKVFQLTEYWHVQEGDKEHGPYYNKESALEKGRSLIERDYGPGIIEVLQYERKDWNFDYANKETVKQSGDEFRLADTIEIIKPTKFRR